MASDPNPALQPIRDHNLRDALGELGRCINLTTTYELDHPALIRAINATEQAMKHLFIHRKQIVIGAIHETLVIDDTPVKTTGALLKSIERRLVRLQIAGLCISRGITTNELEKLIRLLSSKENIDLNNELKQSDLIHVSKVEPQKKKDIVDQSTAPTAHKKPPANLDKIIAFFKNDVELEDSLIGKKLVKLVSSPARMGQLIIESVIILQSVPEFSEESIGDLVERCLNRTYTSLHRQPVFQSPSGKTTLQKALPLLEKSLLKKVKVLGADATTELDCQIVQLILSMTETLEFEIAAQKYVKNKTALEKNKRSMQTYTDNNGRDKADRLVMKTDLSLDEWHSIIVDKNKPKNKRTSDIDNLSSVFKKLESLMKSDTADTDQVKDMLGKANENLDDTLCSTQGKLEILSRQVKDDPGSIGGEGRHMSSEELLSALSEVAQELMQPLTAINASMEMMLKGYVGDISEDQTEMLSMASCSGEHLKFLMVELINIVGCPTNKGIDERYHTTSDQVAQMKEMEGKTKFFQ